LVNDPDAIAYIGLAKLLAELCGVKSNAMAECWKAQYLQKFAPSMRGLLDFNNSKRSLDEIYQDLILHVAQQIT
jgi:hypothetical protein